MQDNIYYLRLTIMKLIDQCGHHCMINNKPAFHNLCESAFEWAWNALGIEENYIQCISSLRGAYDYLTHKFTPDKYQYNDSDITGNLDIDIEENRLLKGDFKCIMNLIQTQKPKTIH